MTEQEKTSHRNRHRPQYVSYQTSVYLKCNFYSLDKALKMLLLIKMFPRYIFYRLFVTSQHYSIEAGCFVSCKLRGNFAKQIAAASISVCKYIVRKKKWSFYNSKSYFLFVVFVAFHNHQQNPKLAACSWRSCLQDNFLRRWRIHVFLFLKRQSLLLLDGWKGDWCFWQWFDMKASFHSSYR